MSNDKMSDELQIAIRRSPDYTAPSAELVALRAEVAAWRRAVRWERQGNDSYTLRLAPAESKPRYDLGGVTEYRDGWMAWRGGGRMQGPSPDRNTACAKVCELLGIPTVLPGGE